VIVIGMHRSGTTMLAGMLAELGLFIGARTDHNNECPLFLALERQILRQSGGSWQCPEALYPLLENAAARAMATDYIRRTLVSPQIIGYLGWTRYLRYRTPANLDFPWGWKSPVTTYTLPLWLDLFPEARVIHLYRHGVDVAQSLRVRAEREQEAVRRRLHVSRKLLYWHWRIISLERGFALWQAYLTQARRHVRALQHQAYELKYEDVLAAPGLALQSLVAFCGLHTTEEEITRVARRVRPERAYAYQDSPELQRFAVRVAPRLHALGFATLVPSDGRGHHVPDRGATQAAAGR
jgi:hypothetical protein